MGHDHWPQPTITETGLKKSCVHCGNPIVKQNGPGSWVHKAHRDAREQERKDKEARKTSKN